ncbi:hypothetical protein RHA1_ro08470 (plasmid) [Rhodococcus jostii RHA1]|uniref:Uncharacterized protein n=1 Tax=Rhodococcus jostii (strain RHA1) TaxID=101510 RepID=Q0RYX2_RHOJR|nr:hypothetical protein RHA1_ro08470 [Rhodococcus jostii RHA1]
MPSAHKIVAKPHNLTRPRRSADLAASNRVAASQTHANRRAKVRMRHRSIESFPTVPTRGARRRLFPTRCAPEGNRPRYFDIDFATEATLTKRWGSRQRPRTRRPVEMCENCPTDIRSNNPQQKCVNLNGLVVSLVGKTSAESEATTDVMWTSRRDSRPGNHTATSETLLAHSPLHAIFHSPLSEWRRSTERETPWPAS